MAVEETPDPQSLSFGDHLPVTQDAIQNGAPDGVLIFHTVSHVVIDALSYEGAIHAAAISGAPGTYDLVEGTVLPTTVADSNTIQGSLIRFPNGADTNNAAIDWTFTTTPTPGAENILTH